MFVRLFAAAVLAVLLALGMAPGARADAVDDALAQFFSGNYDDLEAGVDQLAKTGAPQAPDILNALVENRLYASESAGLVWKDAGDRYHLAKTGEALGDAPEDAQPVRANNRIRRAVEAALGQFNLVSPDAAVRREAALAVYRAKDEAARPMLETALAKETDPAVKSVMELARAAIVLYGTATDQEKLDAVARVAERRDQEARGLLASVPDPSPPVKAAIDKAVSSIDFRLSLWNGVQSVYYGISLGSVLLLAAIGLAITFGVMGVINMAHGEMVMIGAYTTFVVQEVIRNNFPGLFDYSLVFAIPLAFLVSGAIGMLIERSIIRWLYGRPLETLLATFGLSLVLQQAVRSIFGPTNREVGNPAWLSGAFELGGVTLTYNRMWIIVFSVLVLVGLMLVLRYTALGLQMRAVTQNRRMASSMGIRTALVDQLTFGLGSGIAGIAGVALSQIDNVSPNLGQGYIIDSFMVVVFGGVGNLWGTLISALSLGVANKLLEPFAGAVMGKIIVLVALVLFIQRKPRGLFPIKGRAVEQ